jgi:cyclic-di-GMP-binding protein
MADEFSFDVVSKVDLQEVVNSIDQAMREITNRYDFRDTGTEITLDKEKREINISTTDDYKVRAANEVLKTKMVKRGIPIKALKDNDPVQTGMNKMHMRINIQDGIPQEKAKDITKFIKEQKVKVQASIQKDVIRVSGKKKDDLQEIMALLKAKDFGIDMQFTNYR